MAVTVTHATVATGTDAGNGEIRKAHGNANHTVTGVPDIVATSGNPVSVGAVTTEQTLATITVPANAVGTNGYVVVFISFTQTNNANSKTIRVRFGGSAGTAHFDANLANTAYLARLVYVANTNSATAQRGGSSLSNTVGFGAGSSTPVTSTVDTTASWDIVISGQKAVSGDTLTLSQYHVLIYKG